MRPILLGAALLILTSCTGSANPTTTFAVETTTTTSASTTTTSVPTTTTIETSTTLDLSEIEYPTNPQTLDDIPDPLVAYIDAPMPNPDLTVTGPDDLDRWMSGWLDWLAWTHANPAQGAEQLAVNMIPGSEQFEDLQAALVERVEAGHRLLGGGFVPVSLSGTFDEFFEDKSALRIVMVAEGPPSYLVNETGEVVSVFEGLDGEVTVSALLRYDPERSEWLMETFEVLGRS